MKGGLVLSAVLLASGLGAWWLSEERGSEEQPRLPADHAQVDAAPGPILTGRAPPGEASVTPSAATLATPAPSGVHASQVAPARLILQLRGPDRLPVEGVHVRVLPHDVSAPEWGGHTDAAGTLHLSGIAVPHVRVLASAPGFVAVEHREHDLGPGEERSVSLWLAAAVRLDGRVVEAATGRPLAGARVRTRGGGSTDRMSSSGGLESYGETLSDAAGLFRLTELPIDLVVTVWADLEGWTRGEAPVVFRSRSTVREPLVLSLERAGWLVAQVRGPDGEPATGATVEAYREGSNPLQLALPDSEFIPEEASSSDSDHYALVFRGQTDALGACHILGLPFDTPFFVSASAPKLARSISARQVVVTAAEPEARVQLRLRKPATLTFRSVDAGGKPLPDMTPTLWPRTGSETHRWPHEGRVTLPGLRPGRVHVTLSHVGQLPVELDLVLAEGETVERTVRFEEGAAIEGLVVDDTGVPLTGVAVHASQNGQHGAQATTDAQGRFRIAGLLPGEHDLRTYSEGVDFDADEDRAPRLTTNAPAKDVRIVARRQARIVVKFRVPEGGAVPGSIMSWVSDDARGSSSGSGRHWEQGRFEWLLAPGKYRIGLDAQGYAPFERSVEVRAGQLVDWGEVPLDVGLVLEGRVVDEDNRPVADVRVSTGFEGAAVHSGKDGRFVFPHLPRRPITIYARTEEFLDAHQEVDPTRSGAFVTVVLRRGGVLMGLVKTAEGGAGGGLDVAVTPADPSMGGHTHAWTRSDAEGRFQARVVPGRYRVEIRKGEAVLVTGEVIVHDGRKTPLELRIP
jgi:hypothetical protein